MTPQEQAAFNKGRLQGLKEMDLAQALSSHILFKWQSIKDDDKEENERHRKAHIRSLSNFMKLREEYGGVNELDKMIEEKLRIECESNQ